MSTYEERINTAMGDSLSEILKTSQAEESSAVQVQPDSEQVQVPGQEPEPQKPAVTQDVEQKEEPKSNAAELVAKMGRMAKQHRATIQAEKERAAKLEAELKSIREELDSWRKNPYDRIKDNKDIYNKWTEEILQLKPDLEAQKQEEFKTYKQKLEELEKKLLDKEYQERYNAVISDYTTKVNSALGEADYGQQSEYYKLMGTDIVTESLNYANAWAKKFGEQISPKKALLAVVAEADKDLEKFQTFFSSRINKDVAKSAVSESAKPVEKKVEEKVATATIREVLAPPQAVGSQLSYEDRIKAAMSDLNSILNQHK